LSTGGHAAVLDGIEIPIRGHAGHPLRAILSVAGPIMFLPKDRRRERAGSLARALTERKVLLNCSQRLALRSVPREGTFERFDEPQPYRRREMRSGLAFSLGAVVASLMVVSAVHAETIVDVDIDNPSFEA